MDTTGLDQRLRERARKRLRADIDRAIKAFTDALNEIDSYASHSTVKGIKHPKYDRGPYVYELLDPIKEAVFEKFVSSREEKEIAAFLDNVQNFRKQIAELEAEDKQTA